MLYGLGAGGRPTASAVLGDLIDATRNLLAGTTGPAPERLPASLRSMAEACSPFYITLDVEDRPGVLGTVAALFGNHGVSIRSMEQVGLGSEARLIFLTHAATEGDVQATLDDLAVLPAVGRIGGVMRIIGEDDR
jgi:homoserine dehydrogenase